MNGRILLVAGVLAVATLSQANLVINGSFEDPQLGSWSYLDSIPGWTPESGTPPVEIGQAGVYGVTGQDLNQVMELDSTGNVAVSQDLTTSAAQYKLSFLAALRSGTSLETNGVIVEWNGTEIANFTPESTEMKEYTFNVTGIDGTSKLTFKGGGNSDYLGSLVDRVDVQAVPEPASLSILGLGAAALIRRRRKA